MTGEAAVANERERPCDECGQHHFGLRHGQWLYALDHIKDDALASAREENGRLREALSELAALDIDYLLSNRQAAFAAADKAHAALAREDGK